MSELETIWLARCFTELTPQVVQTVRRAYGREAEATEVLQLLASPLPRHPVLLGRSGVGKTAVAQEVALRVQRGACPEALRGLRVLATSPRQLLAGLPPGDGWRSALPQLWEHMRTIGPVLILLQQAHEAAGAGRRGSDETDLAGSLTALLGAGGPADRANVRVLAEAPADRWSHLSASVVLYTNLFVPLTLAEPEGEALQAVIDAACNDLEVEHEVIVTPAARQQAVELTRRYVVNAAFPGKALALLEETMAGAGRESVEPVQVTARFAQRTGLPFILLDENEVWPEEAVRAQFQRRVLGQELAVEAILQRLSLLKAGIHDPNRPLGVFLFVGPTGVGKTELAKALAHFLFGRDDRLVRINMADYSESWQFSQLFGDPDPDEPIEVQRGQLTTRLGEQSFTVLLLDEFEKAFFNIYQRFLQLFDEGVLINGAGEEVNLRNSIIILTSNLAANQPPKGLIGFSPGAPETLEERVLRTAEEFFTPEFVNRIDQVVFFQPLSRATVRRIAFRELENMFQREGIVRRQVQIELEDRVVDWVLEQGYSARFGARYLRRQIEKSISYPIARALIAQPVRPLRCCAGRAASTGWWKGLRLVAG
jgi:ATP-dependent Clp protease ATP-binding subunit ClpC